MGAAGQRERVLGQARRPLPQAEQPPADGAWVRGLGPARRPELRAGAGGVRSAAACPSSRRPCRCLAGAAPSRRGLPAVPPRRAPSSAPAAASVRARTSGEGPGRCGAPPCPREVARGRGAGILPLPGPRLAFPALGGAGCFVPVLWARLAPCPRHGTCWAVGGRVRMAPLCFRGERESVSCRAARGDIPLQRGICRGGGGSARRPG